MGKDRKVVVCGGGSNLYRISESDGWFYAYHIRVRFLGNAKDSLGRTRTLDDALALIRAHSGREIEEIS